jgi:hypothetical protein
MTGSRMGRLKENRHEDLPIPENLIHLEVSRFNVDEI